MPTDARMILLVVLIQEGPHVKAKEFVEEGSQHGEHIIVAAAVAVITSLLVWRIQWSIEKRHKQEEGKKQRGVLLSLFALESVRLFTRFVQYSIQGMECQFSFSRPYELLSSAQVQQLVGLGVEHHVAAAIYQIRQLNSLVTLQVDRAYQEMIQGTNISLGPVGLPAVQTPFGDVRTHFPTFARIVTFVHDEFRKTRGICLARSPAKTGCSA
jgi:hypothetical protein